MGREFEDVEQPFVAQLQTLGWTYLAGSLDTPAATGRSSFTEVIQEGVLRECLRVLRPGGMLRVSCPSLSHGMRVGKWLGAALDPGDHKVIGYDSRDIAAQLPQGAQVGRVSYQGRFIESNMSDAQFLVARALEMSGNPAVS